MSEVKEIKLTLDRERAEFLARIFGLMKINIELNPQIYSEDAKFNATQLLDTLDYQIHEVGNWCDRSDCSYWIKKKALENKKPN